VRLAPLEGGQDAGDFVHELGPEELNPDAGTPSQAPPAVSGFILFAHGAGRSRRNNAPGHGTTVIEAVLASEIGISGKHYREHSFPNLRDRDGWQSWQGGKLAPKIALFSVFFCDFHFANWIVPFGKVSKVAVRRRTLECP
jgi:hypothetical protein